MYNVDNFRLYNHVQKASKLPSGCDYSLFKVNIEGKRNYFLVSFYYMYNLTLYVITSTNLLYYDSMCIPDQIT